MIGGLFHFFGVSVPRLRKRLVAIRSQLEKRTQSAPGDRHGVEGESPSRKALACADYLKLPLR
jgi:hypothetical protein